MSYNLRPKKKKTIPVFDMEYKWEVDDAWHGVGVVVNMETEMETVTVKFKDFPARNELKFSSVLFKTAAEVDEFVSRFHVCSKQVQDNQCSKKINKGLKVCALYKKDHHHLRYDAIVEAVHQKEHSFVNGEEKCLCSFVLVWVHGPSCGNSTSVGIESIRNIVPTTRVDSRIAVFSKFVKEKIIQNKSHSSQHDKSSGSRSTGEGLMISSTVGRERGKTYGVNSREYLILIGNMEKDLLPSSITQFIHQQTSIQSHAYVFPSLAVETFTRGAIVVDCRKKREEIYDFLTNRNHFIVSTRGRPWVMMEHESSQEMFGTTNGSLDRIWQNHLVSRNISSEAEAEGLSVVHSGSEAYMRAKGKRDVFMAFVNYQRLLYKRYAFDENKILQS